jgi:hypothetical protein
MRSIMRHSPTAKSIITRQHLPKLAFGILALAGTLYIGIECVYAAQNQPLSASGAQAKIYSIGKEELKAYDDFMLESDPQKRAAKLYEFIQKYPKSPTSA